MSRLVHHPAKGYKDPPAAARCQRALTMADESLAQCGRRRQPKSAFCWQHQTPAADPSSVPGVIVDELAGDGS